MSKFKKGDIITGNPLTNQYVFLNQDAIMQVIEICNDNHIIVKVIDVTSTCLSRNKNFYKSIRDRRFSVNSKYFIKLGSVDSEWD